MWALTPLTEEQREIQRAARDFALAELAPHSAAWDRDAYFEPSLVHKAGALGFLGMMVPEQYDGLGLETLTYLVALEEIAIVDASVAVMISVHNSLPTQMILRWGTEEQKSRFLKPMASGTSGDVILTMARTDTPHDRRGARGISAFIITPDLPGFRVGKKEDKMG